MINISQGLKDLYQQDSVSKTLIIECYGAKKDIGSEDPEKTPFIVSNENIVFESMKLSESLCESERLEIGNVVSSQFEIDLINVEDLIGNYIKVYITIADSTYKLPLFSGYVDNSKLQNNREIRHIIAYDDIYNISDTDVTSWYLGLGTNPMTLLNFRNALFTKIGLEYEIKDLPNDLFNVYIDPTATNITARNLLEDVCEINGCFGVINRNNKFEFRTLNEISTRYPKNNLYPSSTIYPGWYILNASIVELSTYNTVDYGEYEVLPITKVEVYAKNANNVDVKQAEFSDPNPTSYSGGFNGINVYKILDNNLIKNGFFTAAMANGIYDCISNNNYTPVYRLETKGLPFIEVGDVVEVELQDGAFLTFPIFRRTLTGLQSLKDTYEASGEEYHDKEFKF